jgi:hypothetical protein
MYFYLKMNILLAVIKAKFTETHRNKVSDEDQFKFNLNNRGLGPLERYFYN